MGGNLFGALWSKRIFKASSSWWGSHWRLTIVWSCECIVNWRFFGKQSFVVERCGLSDFWKVTSIFEGWLANLWYTWFAGYPTIRKPGLLLTHNCIVIFVMSHNMVGKEIPPEISLGASFTFVRPIWNIECLEYEDKNNGDKFFLELYLLGVCMTSLLVSLVPERCKAADAVVSLEGLIAGVRSHVDLQVPLLREGFSATWIRAGELGLRGVGMLMVLVDSKSVFSSEWLVALAAEELLLIRRSFHS